MPSRAIGPQSLRELVQDMERGRVELLVILGGNPVYTAPADLDFAEHLQKVPLSDSSRPVRGRDLAAMSLASARGALPGGVERRPGVRRNGVDRAAADRAALSRAGPPHEVVALLADLHETSGREIVRDHWRRQWELRHEAGRLRAVLAEGPARRRDSRHGLRSRRPSSSRTAGRSHCDADRRSRHRQLVTSLPRETEPEIWKSSSSPTRRSTTARGPTTAGCRNCPSRSRSSPGAMRPS